MILEVFGLLVEVLILIFQPSLPIFHNSKIL